jgi:hypothetical protein
MYSATVNPFISTSTRSNDRSTFSTLTGSQLDSAAAVGVVVVVMGEGRGRGGRGWDMGMMLVMNMKVIICNVTVSHP